METQVATSVDGTGDPLLHPWLCMGLRDVKFRRHSSGCALRELSPSFSLMRPKRIVRGEFLIC